MLLERYKIRYEALGTCFIDDDTLRYIAGYNQVSIPAIEARYGKGLLTKVREEAEAEYELKYAKQYRESMRLFMEALKTLPKKDN
jgi:phosphoserine phosphatase